MQLAQLSSVLAIGQATFDVQQGAFVECVKRRQVHEAYGLGQLARRGKLLGCLPQSIGAFATLGQSD